MTLEALTTNHTAGNAAEYIVLDVFGETNQTRLVKSEPTKFSLFTTDVLKASMGTDGKKRIRGIASSTTKDLHGDTIKSTAIEDMVRAASQNMTIFLNHSYKVPEDVAGSVERASSIVSGVDHAGSPNTDLIMDILVDESNPRAIQTWESINRGVKLGLSIGASLPPGSHRKNNEGGYDIEHINLMETSIVSLPANPRSWVEYAIKALDPTLYESQAEPTVVAQATTTEPATETIEAAAVTEPAEPVTPDLTNATVSISIDTQSHGKGDSTAAPPSSQEVPGAEAGVSALAEENADGEDAMLEDPTKSAVLLTTVITQFKQVADELLVARTSISEITEKLTVVTSERDTAVSERDRVLTETAALLSRLADTPLVRKTVAIESNVAFRQKFARWFDDDILGMLEKHNG